MTNDTRAAFEAWMSEDGKFPRAIVREPCRDGYRLMIAQTSWTAWQAAYLASRRAALEECAQLAEIMAENANRYGYSDASREDRRVAAAIRALGDEGVKP